MIGIPNSELFNAAGFLISKFYSNTLLRVLNSRSRTEYAPDVLTLPVSLESPNISQQDQGLQVAETCSGNNGLIWLRKREEVV